MEVRTATPADLPIIANLLTQMREMDIDPSTLTQLDKFIDSPDRAIILIPDETGKPVGMAAVNLIYKLPKIECRIDEVIVSSEVRGKGYGKKLMAACEAWAWNHHSDIIELTSRPSREAANHLYQSIGYTIRETNVYIKKQQELVA